MFDGWSATFEQVTTRGDGKLELHDRFGKDEIDFGAVRDHLRIHEGGQIAGSQFNGDIFQSPDDVVRAVQKLLPETMSYDQFDRAEITLDVKLGSDQPIGGTGVKSLDEIHKQYPDARIEKRARIPGGFPGVEEGEDGIWYPETVRDSDSGRFVVAINPDGTPKNLHGKFEPLANIAILSGVEAAPVEKVTVVIQKDRQTGKPTVLTIFPGENAPAFPAKINSESYKASSLGNTNEKRYWAEHAFLQKG